MWVRKIRDTVVVVIAWKLRTGFHQKIRRRYIKVEGKA